MKNNKKIYPETTIAPIIRAHRSYAGERSLNISVGWVMKLKQNLSIRRNPSPSNSLKYPSGIVIALIELIALSVRKILFCGSARGGN